MISSLNASDQSFIVALGQIQAEDQTAQTELSTGLKINTVSDAPDQISNLLQTQSELSQTQQIETNLDQVNTEVNTAESTLESSVSLVERAETLGTEGANNISTSANNQNLADELGSVLQQLVSNANTTVAGRYIFSGDSDQPRPTVSISRNPIRSVPIRGAPPRGRCKARTAPRLPYRSPRRTSLTVPSHPRTFSHPSRICGTPF